MIEYTSETNFTLSKENSLTQWIESVIASEGYELGDIHFVFCDDEALHKINVEFLHHDTYTDIISFDYSLGKQIHGEIFISIDRVTENAEAYKVSFTEELHRVMIHGILHYCGFKDGSSEEKTLMRSKENEALGTRDFV
tara:strand:+ start:11173 stop:11589 length:417 start_codon:yes stop_codon:yes gene_type:complete